MTPQLTPQNSEARVNDMAKNALITARQAESISASGSYRAGDNLYLEVEVRGEKIYKRWRLRYNLLGVSAKLGLGAFPKVTFKAAKEDAAAKMKAFRETGKFPSDDRDVKKAKVKTKAKQIIAGRDTFKVIAEKYIEEVKVPEWKPDPGRRAGSRSRGQWESSLADYIYPHIGHLSMDEINRDHILKILKPIWLEKHVTAERVMYRTKSIIEYAIETDARSLANPITKTFVRVRLPRWTGSPKHLVALPYDDLPDFWADLEQRRGRWSNSPPDSSDVIRMIVLTSMRQKDVRMATWNSIDLKKATWTVNLSKSTLGQVDRLHLVHLPKPLVDMLRRRLKEKPKSAYVFDNSHYAETGNKPKGETISDKACNDLLRDMGYTDVFGQKITMHGFRSTFTDWVRENGIEEGDIAEMQLAHAIKDKTLAAYARGKLWDRRVKVINLYAEYATGLKL